MQISDTIPKFDFRLGIFHKFRHGDEGGGRVKKIRKKRDEHSHFYRDEGGGGVKKCQKSP